MSNGTSEKSGLACLLFLLLLQPAGPKESFLVDTLC